MASINVSSISVAPQAMRYKSRGGGGGGAFNLMNIVSIVSVGYLKCVVDAVALGLAILLLSCNFLVQHFHTGLMGGQRVTLNGNWQHIIPVASYILYMYN